MNFTAEQTADASVLVAFAIQPTVRPSSEPDYLRLVRLYMDDTVGLAQLVTVVLGGLGLRPVGASERSGLVVAAEDGSPLALRLEDYKARLEGGWETPDRFLHGLLHVAVATWCYPSDLHLQRRDTVTITVPGVMRWLDALAETRAAEATEEEAPTAPELEEGWRLWRQLSNVDDSADRRSVPSSKPGRLRQVLGVLERQGLLRAMLDGSWQTTERYQLMVTDAASDPAFAEFGELARRTQGRSDAEGDR